MLLKKVLDVLRCFLLFYCVSVCLCSFQNTLGLDYGDLVCLRRVQIVKVAIFVLDGFTMFSMFENRVRLM